MAILKADKEEQERIKRFITKSGDQDRVREEIRDGLRYISGEATVPNVNKSLEQGPRLQRNDIKKYKDWTVSHIRVNPYKITIEAREDTPQTRAIATELQEDIDNAINSPTGRESTECALNTMTSVGYGYTSYELDYISNRSMDQTVKSNPVKVPQNVYFGIDDSIDGSGANECMIKRVMDRDRAEKLIGKNKLKLNDAKDWQISMFGSWDWNSDTVPDITYSYIKEKSRTQHFNEDGDPIEEKQEGSFKREIIDSTVCVVRYIGGYRYESAEYPSNLLPITAMRGDTKYRDDLGDCEYSYSGYYQLLKDLQEVLKYLLNEAIILASKASKTPYVAVEGQLDGYEDEWENDNVKDYKVLYYKNITLNGTTAPPPQRMDNSAQVEWVLSYTRDVVATMQQIIGITPQMMGMEESRRETVKATELRGTAGGLTVAGFLDNCEKSIINGAKIVTDLAIHARPNRLIKFTPEDSEEEIEEVINLSELGVSHSDFVYRPTQGPANESKRQSELNLLMSMGQYAPQDFANVQDLVVERMNSSADQELVDRYKAIIKMRAPQLFNEEGQEDPEAVQALEALSAQLQEAQMMLEQVVETSEAEKGQMALLINQLQTELQVNRAEAQAKVLAEETKQQAETERNTQDNLTDIAVAKIKEGQAISTEVIKQESAIEQKELEITTTAIESLQKQETDDVDMHSPVKGGVQHAPELTKTGQNLVDDENEGNLEATQ